MTTKKITVAVLLKMPGGLRSGMTAAELTKAFKFYDPAKMIVRDIVEVARLEIDGITDAQQSQAGAMLLAIGREIAARWLGSFGPIGMEEAVELVLGPNPICQVSIEDVANLPVNYPRGLDPADPSVTCPKCGKPMIKRKAKNRDEMFYGCTDYPGCNGTRNINR